MLGQLACVIHESEVILDLWFSGVFEKAKLQVLWHQ